MTRNRAFLVVATLGAIAGYTGSVLNVWVSSELRVCEANMIHLLVCWPQPRDGGNVSMVNEACEPALECF